MNKVLYVEGKNGAVGTHLREQLTPLLENGLLSEVLALSPRSEAEKVLRQEYAKKADIIAVCLPDSIAPEAIVELRAINPRARIVDASASSRCNLAWTYGMLDLKGSRERIRDAFFISNPGCFASACIMGARPLVESGLIAFKEEMTFFGLTGYSAGGKRYAEPEEQASLPKIAQAGTPHRHLPEILRYGGVNAVLTTTIGPWERGMLVQFSLPLEAPIVLSAYRDFIEKHQAQNLHVEFARHQSSTQLGLEACNGTNDIRILVADYGEERTVVSVVLDNLGRGSAGNLAECIALMCQSEINFDEEV